MLGKQGAHVVATGACACYHLAHQSNQRVQTDAHVRRPQHFPSAQNKIPPATVTTARHFHTPPGQGLPHPRPIPWEYRTRPLEDMNLQDLVHRETPKPDVLGALYMPKHLRHPRGSSAVLLSDEIAEFTVLPKSLPYERKDQGSNPAIADSKHILLPP